VLGQHQVVDLRQGPLDRLDLADDVDAVGVLLHHPGDPLHMPGDAAQAPQDLRLRLGLHGLLQAGSPPPGGGV
jgi:hypothetical protein